MDENGPGARYLVVKAVWPGGVEVATCLFEDGTAMDSLTYTLRKTGIQMEMFERRQASPMEMAFARKAVDAGAQWISDTPASSR